LRLQLGARRKIDGIQGYLQNLQLLIRAKERGIPTRRHAHKRIYQLGYGAQKNLMANGFTDHTSKLASDIAQDKFVASSVMREAFLPAPKHFMTRTIEEAKQAAKQIKYPLVVKPRSKGKGVGVTAGVTNDLQLESAWLAASPHGEVLIEEMLEGLDHRLHVVDGNCFYVIRRSPPYIVGDGISTVEKLFEVYIAKRSAEPKYSKYPNADLNDPIVRKYLMNQNLTLSSIPEKDRVIYLRSNSNVSTGGFMDDVTAQCHPDNKLLAERVARAVGLDNAGVDYITTDIERSWMDVGGGICEVNATPGFISEDGIFVVLDYLFPKGRTGRIPIILIIGETSALQDYFNSLTNTLGKEFRTYGYIYNQELHVYTSNGVFRTRGKKTQDLLIGLLTDELVESAFIQLDIQEINAGLDLQYIDLLVAIGTETEISLIQESDLLGRCNQKRVLINPTVDIFQNYINEVLKTSN
jgi:cyanophycin synthetase